MPTFSLLTHIATVLRAGAVVTQSAYHVIDS